jgi:aminopeptidase N
MKFLLVLVALFTGLVLNAPSIANIQSVDVLHYDLSLNLLNNLTSPYKKSFDGSVTINARALVETNEISLNAHNYSLLIDAVSGSSRSFSHAGNKLAIVLDRSYAEGEEFKITIRFRHKDVFDTSFYCNDGLVYTDSESAGARRWFPCKDVPNDKATVKITADVPEGVQFCANGLMTDSTSSSGKIRYVYESKHLVATYLIAFVASKKYLLAVEGWKFPSADKGAMQVRYYYQRGETMFNLKNVMLKTNRMLDYFSEIYCEYPFEKLGFATTDRHFPWGGMENQTIITLCPDCWIEDLICHELIHQWFGDMITPETWADIWLNEGFATYNEALWIEKAYGKKRYQEAVEYEATKYLNSNAGWAIYNPEWKTEEPNDAQVFDPGITYSKASCILYMLRHVLGDEVFFDVLKKYANDERFRYGNISTEAFENFVEEVSGKDLGWFFQQWIYGPNHPVYQLNYTKDKTDEGKWKVQYVIIQTQKNSGYFKMPVEIEVTFMDGSTTSLSENNDYNMQTYDYTFDKEPLKMKFDPRNTIILKEVK